MKLASKSKKRIELLDVIVSGITGDEIFETINYKKQSEDKIKQFVYPNLLNEMTSYISNKKGFSSELAREKAKTTIKWEGDKKTTIRNMQFMGTGNRPDMTLDIDGIKVAIEFKRGKNGSSLRDGFGQSMIYSTVYDFVIYLFIDTSEDCKILNGSTSIMEEQFLENLWDNFNIKFAII